MTKNIHLFTTRGYGDSHPMHLMGIHGWSPHCQTHFFSLFALLDNSWGKLDPEKSQSEMSAWASIFRIHPHDRNWEADKCSTDSINLVCLVSNRTADNMPMTTQQKKKTAYQWLERHVSLDEMPQRLFLYVHCKQQKLWHYKLHATANKQS